MLWRRLPEEIAVGQSPDTAAGWEPVCSERVEAAAFRLSAHRARLAQWCRQLRLLDLPQVWAVATDPLSLPAQGPATAVAGQLAAAAERGGGARRRQLTGPVQLQPATQQACVPGWVEVAFEQMDCRDLPRRALSLGSLVEQVWRERAASGSAEAALLWQAGGRVFLLSPLGEDFFWRSSASDRALRDVHSRQLAEDWLAQTRHLLGMRGGTLPAKQIWLSAGQLHAHLCRYLERAGQHSLGAALAGLTPCLRQLQSLRLAVGLLSVSLLLGIYPACRGKPATTGHGDLYNNFPAAIAGEAEVLLPAHCPLPSINRLAASLPPGVTIQRLHRQRLDGSAAGALVEVEGSMDASLEDTALDGLLAKLRESAHPVELQWLDRPAGAAVRRFRLHLREQP